MGLRFRKRIKLLPGLFLNLSKTGISTSIGGKGLTVNLRRGKARTTVGLPGTGISYRTTTTSGANESADGPRVEGGGIPLWMIAATVILLVYFMS